MQKRKQRKNQRRRPRRSKMAIESFISSNPTMKKPISMWFVGDPLILSVANGSSTFSTTTVAFDQIGKLGAVGNTVVGSFQDFRFLKIRATMHQIGDNAGVTVYGFTEEAGITVSNYATNANVMYISNSNKRPPRVLEWTAASYSDLTFTDVTATISPAPVTFYAYTNNTDFSTATNGTGSAITYFRVVFDILCEFRGVGN